MSSHLTQSTVTAGKATWFSSFSPKRGALYPFSRPMLMSRALTGCLLAQPSFSLLVSRRMAWHSQGLVKVRPEVARKGWAMRRNAQGTQWQLGECDAQVVVRVGWDHVSPIPLFFSRRFCPRSPENLPAGGQAAQPNPWSGNSWGRPGPVLYLYRASGKSGVMVPARRSGTLDRQ